ncbi:hypothetical protein HanPI659440_Chr04g0147991 [Helianthus annuus]|nr:hypothetical protein HanPI659440_Chr04g0147991 [Helianthus annuus]
MKTSTVRNKCIILVLLLLILMGAGTGLLFEVEDLDFVHAFYCVVATLTGLGYIHTCFSTTGSAVAVHFRFAVTEQKQRSLVKWVLKRNTTSDLEAADFDGDGVVV